MNPPRLFMIAFILVTLSGVGYFIYKNPKIVSNSLPKQCEERLLPKVDLGATCPNPSRLMKVGDQWICSCRSEEQTMKGIKP